MGGGGGFDRKEKESRLSTREKGKITEKRVKENSGNKSVKIKKKIILNWMEYRISKAVYKQLRTQCELHNSHLLTQRLYNKPERKKGGA